MIIEGGVGVALIRYDDFDQFSEKWKFNVLVGGGSYNISNSVLRLVIEDAPSEAVVAFETRKSDWGVGKYRIKARYTSASGAGSAPQLTLKKTPDSNVDDEMAIIKLEPGTGIIANVRVNGSWGTAANLGTVAADTWYILEIEVTQDTIYMRAYDEQGNLIGEQSFTNLPNFGFPNPRFVIDIREGVGADGGSVISEIDYIEVDDQYMPRFSIDVSVSGNNVTVVVKNISSYSGTFKVVVKDSSGNVVDSKTGFLDGGSTAEVTFTLNDGSYTIEVINVDANTVDDSQTVFITAGTTQLFMQLFIQMMPLLMIVVLMALVLAVVK